MGEIKSIESLTTESVSGFYRKRCVPNNIVIAISGDMSAKEMISKLTERFSGLKKGADPTAFASSANAVTAKTVRVAMDKEQSLVILGFRVAPRNDPDRYALETLSAVLNGCSGRLFHALRNRLSLAYSVGCWIDFWTDEGVFAVYAATTNDELSETKDALAYELRRIGESGITDEELAQAKRELCCRHQMAMQSNSFHTFNFAVEELRGLGYDNIYKYESEIDKVTCSNVRDVAGKYLTIGKCVEVVISPEKNS
jgi:predicted Zn-dependent peptidase